MRIIFLGDIVGRTGRKAVVNALPELRTRYRADFIIVNGENAASGFGINEAMSKLQSDTPSASRNICRVTPVFPAEAVARAKKPSAAE